MFFQNALIFFLSLTMLQAYALHCELYPLDMKAEILTRVGGSRPLKDILKDIASLKLVNREISELLSQRTILTELLRRSSFETDRSSCIPIEPRDDPHGRIFSLGVKREGPAIRSIQADNSILPELSSCLCVPYTVVEHSAITTYLVDSLLLNKLTPDECMFLSKFVECNYNKGLFIHFLLLDMEKWYQLNCLALNNDQRTGFFSYRSLSTQDPSLTLLRNRFKKLKLIVPFYVDMCRCGFVPICFPALISAQVVESGDYFSEPSLKNELAKICFTLAEEDFDPKSRSMYKEYAEELLLPPPKRVTVDPAVSSNQ